MKKVLKSLSLICLAILMVCPLLVGCSKNLTINVSVEGVGGGVYLFSNSQSENTGKNIVGDNVVKEGNDFEYRVSPSHGYRIAKVEVDGMEVTLTDSEKKQGKVLALGNVKKDHNIKVSFELGEWEVKFKCIDGEFAIRNVTHNSALNVGTSEFGGENNELWYVINSGQRVYLINGQDDPSEGLATDWNKNQIVINGDRDIYCDLTLAELNALIGD